MNDYQLQLECDLALKRVMHRVDVFIRNEKRLWEFVNIWHPMRVYPYYSDSSMVFNSLGLDGGHINWCLIDEMGQSC